MQVREEEARGTSRAKNSSLCLQACNVGGHKLLQPPLHQLRILSSSRPRSGAKFVQGQREATKAKRCCWGRRGEHSGQARACEGGGSRCRNGH